MFSGTLIFEQTFWLKYLHPYADLILAPKGLSFYSDFNVHFLNNMHNRLTTIQKSVNTYINWSKLVGTTSTKQGFVLL